MKNLNFDELLNIFGKDEISEILKDKLLEEQSDYNYLRSTYDRKKDYVDFKTTDPRTPKTKTYFELRSQLLDLELLPKLEKSVKKLNKYAYQLLSLEGRLPDDKRLDEMKLDNARQTPIESLYEGKLRGNTRLSGKCPFHADKTPSFVIYTKDNSFHCFGCGAHGFNAIDYVMKQDGVDFLDAVRRLI